MYSMQNLKPIELNDLARIGRFMDGGYVLSKSQIEKSQVLLSFGINDDWSFEWDFVKNKNVALHGFDYSVSKEMFSKSVLIKNIFRSLKLFFIKRQFSEAARILEWTRNKKNFPFWKMFNEKENRFFHKKFLGNLDNEQFISVPNVFKYAMNAKEQSIFVKIDIEGAEYEVLPEFEPYFELINGFAIEFHDLDCKGELFEAIIEKLKEFFYIAHVHGNNCAEIIRGTALPSVLEITFIKKELLPVIPMESSKEYPIKGLDFSCSPGADIPLFK